MSDVMVVDIGRETLMMVMLIGGPLLMLALVVGLTVSIFQAATQINEMTMTFIPKIVTVGVALVLLLPWMLNLFVDFTNRLFERIPQLLR